MRNFSLLAWLNMFATDVLFFSVLELGKKKSRIRQPS